MTRVIIIFAFVALAGSAIAQQDEPSKIFDIYYSQDFENHSLGQYSYTEWYNNWNSPVWGVIDFCEIIDLGDVNGQSMLVRFPQGSTYGDGGMHWYCPLGNSYEELYFSFRVKFKPGFEPVLSGKLPGVLGGPQWGEGPPAYDDGFAAKLTWSWIPDIAVYSYHHDIESDIGESWAIDYGIPDGVWITFTIRIVMNTIGENGGNNDGIFETFVDGRLQHQITNLRFRNVENIGTDNLEIVSFFGGSGAEWAAIRDEWIEFDNFYAFSYKSEVDVPHGNEISLPDRMLLLPDQAYNDSIWRKSLTAEAFSSKTVGLEWQSYFYPVSYTIQRRLASDTVFQDIGTIDFPDNSFDDSDLSPNTTYYYRIKVDNSISDEVFITTQSPAPPQAPVSLVSLSTEKTTARIGWTDNSENEIGFIIERSDITPDNFSQIATVNRDTEEFTSSSLAPNTTYYYRVKAYNEDGQSAYSNTLEITTLQLQLPGAPSGLNATGITKNSFILNWNDNSGNESGFQIYKLDESTSTFLLNRLAAANQTQLAITDLQPNTTYSFKVRAYNDDGVSGFTNEINVTTLPLQPPVAPITLICDTVAPSSAYLRWTDRSDNETGFQIYRSTEETAGYQLIHTNSSNQNTYTSNNLDQGTAYFFRVRAYNNDGVSSYTNTLQIITPNPPRSPTNLVLTNKSVSAVSFEWTDNSDNETGFFLERSESTPTRFFRTDTLEANTTSFADQNLLSNTLYYYRLAAFNQDGSSSYSDTLSARTDQTILPAPPSDLIMVSITPFSVDISWDDNSTNETGFQVQRADQGNPFENLVLLDSDVTYYSDSELEQNSVYHFLVRAFNDNGYSAFSDTLTIHTPENIIPPIPGNFKVDLIRYDKVILTWDADMSHITGFEIERAAGDSDDYTLIAKTGIGLTCTDTAVVQGIDYTYRIRSFNTYNYSPYSLSIDVSVPFLVLPEPPELLEPVDIESNTIAIKWTDKSTNESGFSVKRALYPQTDFKELYLTGPDDTLFVDRTVSPNTTYYYMVNSINENGQSKNSNQLRVSSLSLAEAARFREGLIAYYNFSLNSDTIIHDLSKYGSPVDLIIADTMSVNWTRNSRFEIISNTMIRSQYPAVKIVEACKKTNEITLECWIRPTINAYNSDATIISLSDNPENLGISLMQSDYSFTENNNYQYLLGLSTKSTESSGRPYLTTGENDIITMHHIAYTRNSLGEEKLYINGIMVATSLKPLGFDNWKDNYHLYLGNESTMQKPWTGIFYLMAVYNMALTSDQIKQNYNVGPTDNIIDPDNVFEVTLFPNPSPGRVVIDIKPVEFSDYGEKVILQLIDLHGSVHLEEVIHDSNRQYFKEFDLSYLEKGLYYIRLISTTGTSTQKVILY